MVKDKVSVVIPTYKRPEMLERAIMSVKKQTYGNIEIIVVDDNGEGTKEQIETKRIIEQFSDVKYIVHAKNKGGSAARNSGWKVASGNYITFLDDDDEILEDKIFLQVKRLEELGDEYGACYTAYHIIMGNGTVQKSATTAEGDVYVQALARSFYVGSGSNLLVRMKWVDEISGYDEEFVRNQDIEFMARLFEKTRVAFVDKDLLRIHLEIRQFTRTLDFYENVTDFYLKKMNCRIEKLSQKERKYVLDTITLERARVANGLGNRKLAFSYIRTVKVSRVIAYVAYLIKRVLTKKSYGFKW